MVKLVLDRDKFFVNITAYEDALRITKSLATCRWLIIPNVWCRALN
jgi:hypothetical protein